MILWIYRYFFLPKQYHNNLTGCNDSLAISIFLSKTQQYRNNKSLLYTAATDRVSCFIVAAPCHTQTSMILYIKGKIDAGTLIWQMYMCTSDTQRKTYVVCVYIYVLQRKTVSGRSILCFVYFITAWLFLFGNIFVWIMNIVMSV